jgi:hypothetical protein
MKRLVRCKVSDRVLFSAGVDLRRRAAAAAISFSLLFALDKDHLRGRRTRRSDGQRGAL